MFSDEDGGAMQVHDIELLMEETVVSIPELGVAPCHLLLRAVALAKVQIAAGDELTVPSDYNAMQRHGSIEQWLQVGVATHIFALRPCSSVANCFSGVVLCPLSVVCFRKPSPAARRWMW